MSLSRATCFRRKPLIFTESPVELRHIPVTPVLCADKPITAVSVPITEDCNQPWVSPQFPDCHCCRGKRRHKRHEPHKKVSDPSASDKGSTQDGNGKENKHQKYRALTFATHFERGAPSNPLQNICETCQSHRGPHPCHCNVSHGGHNDICLERKRHRTRGCKNMEAETRNVGTDTPRDQRHWRKGVNKASTLLVLDTPEHEYHLSYRQRQLKKAESLVLLHK